jgi:hypothetical protein
MAQENVPLAPTVSYQRAGQLWLYPAGVLPWEAPKAGTPLLASELDAITEASTIQLRADLAKANMLLERERAAHAATKAKLDQVVEESREALTRALAGKPPELTAPAPLPASDLPPGHNFEGDERSNGAEPS